MLSQALRLLVHDRPTLRRMIRLKLLDRWCRLHAQWGFYCQARMDIDPSSWWHNTEFVSASGGYVVPGDATPRKVLPLEAWDTVRRDMILLLLRELIAREVQGDLAELGVYRGV